MSGSLPDGVSLDSTTGVLSGTPTQAGSSSFTAAVQDARGTAASHAFTLVVDVAKPIPMISSVVNGASFGSAGIAAPASIVTVFSTALGSTDQLSGFPATDLSGVSVLFNGEAAPLFALAASRNQINVLAPNDLPISGIVTVQVTSPLGSSATFPLQMAAAAPGISRVSENYAVALLANTSWLAIPSTAAQTLDIPACSTAGVTPQSTCAQAAASGDVLQIYVTGLGKATPHGDANGRQLQPGATAPSSGEPLYLTVEQPSVTIGGKNATVLFSGLAPGYAGLYQVNVRVPGNSPTGDQIPIQIEMPGGAQDAAWIGIR